MGPLADSFAAATRMDAVDDGRFRGETQPGWDLGGNASGVNLHWVGRRHATATAIVRSNDTTVLVAQSRQLALVPRAS